MHIDFRNLKLGTLVELTESTDMNNNRYFIVSDESTINNNDGYIEPGDVVLILRKDTEYCSQNPLATEIYYIVLSGKWGYVSIGAGSIKTIII